MALSAKNIAKRRIIDLATPLLKWAGGKRQLLPELLDRVPKKFDRYFEPFIGGGALFFALQPKKAIISDINPELINTYICVRDRLVDLITALSDHQDRHSSEYYYQVRASAPEGAVDRAARFIYIGL